MTGPGSCFPGIRFNYRGVLLGPWDVPITFFCYRVSFRFASDVLLVVSKYPPDLRKLCKLRYKECITKKAGRQFFRCGDFVLEPRFLYSFFSLVYRPYLSLRLSLSGVSVRLTRILSPCYFPE